MDQHPDEQHSGQQSFSSDDTKLKHARKFNRNRVLWLSCICLYAQTGQTLNQCYVLGMFCSFMFHQGAA